MPIRNDVLLSFLVLISAPAEAAQEHGGRCAQFDWGKLAALTRLRAEEAASQWRMAGPVEILQRPDGLWYARAANGAEMPADMECK